MSIKTFFKSVFTAQEIIVTRAQADVVLGKIVRAFFIKYYPMHPEYCYAFMRVAIDAAKQNGTVAVQNLVQVIIQELYRDVKGVNPVGDPAFRHWVHQALQDKTPSIPDPIKSVSGNDSFDATPGSIN